MCEVLIVYTIETQDWAKYLRVILEASHHFPRDSITLFYVDEGRPWQDEDYSIFQSSKCVLLLLSEAFLDLYTEPDLKNIFEMVLQPPWKIVAFMCGVSELDGLKDYFLNWESWHKLDSEDDPANYVSTVLDVVAEVESSLLKEDVAKCEDQWRTDYAIPPPKQHNNSTVSKYDQTASDYCQPPRKFDPPDSEFEKNASENDLTASEEPEELDFSQIKPIDPYVLDENPIAPVSTTEVSSGEQTCLTVHPHRILCGTRVDIFFIMVNKLDSQASVEVEFKCEQSAKRVPGMPVNEYVVRVQSPDMPAGVVPLHLYSNESILCSTSVTYYTEMGEINSYLENVMDPIQFMCQAFNITSNASEALDDLFTASFKSQMPACGLQVFGNSQLEQENTLANERKVELPTLLHFSAKYGLKKLTRALLQCPGALQAYSVVNKNGDYPNTLAEKSGFSDLRQIMDKYVETVDAPNIEESVENPGEMDIYEPMANASLHSVQKFCLQEDIYESMMELNPDMLYEDLDSALNASQPEEALRIFFQDKSKKYSETSEDDLGNNGYPDTPRVDELEDAEEEDPYKICCPEEIYDTVDEHENTAILNRPPAPIPRSVTGAESDSCKTYISTVFCSKDSVYSLSNRSEKESSKASVWPVSDGSISSSHDPYAGMKTPGQKQLISLQERVKVGALTVEEAVQEFKAWQFDQEKRSQSVRFQQDNIQKLRDSIVRRHKERGKVGKLEELEITAPMQRNLLWGSQMKVECSVYEPTPRTVNQPPVVTNRPPQRGTWQTGSASSTSSSSSNRLSTLSTISYSSGPDGELEEPQEIPPPRPPRPVAEAPPSLPPPRVPRRQPERFPESMLNERYVSSPARALPQTPPQRPIPPPPVPRRPV